LCLTSATTAYNLTRLPKLLTGAPAGVQPGRNATSLGGLRLPGPEAERRYSAIPNRLLTAQIKSSSSVWEQNAPNATFLSSLLNWTAASSKSLDEEKIYLLRRVEVEAKHSICSESFGQTE